MHTTVVLVHGPDSSGCAPPRYFRQYYSKTFRAGDFAGETVEKLLENLKDSFTVDANGIVPGLHTKQGLHLVLNWGFR